MTMAPFVLQTAEQAQRLGVVLEAHTWLGTAFHHRARVKGVGVDCAQLLIGVFSGAGIIAAFTPPPYPHDFMLHSKEPIFENIVRRFGREVECPGSGDVVLFFVGKCYSHGGIILNWPDSIIHARFRGCVEITDPRRDGSLMNRKHKFFSPWGV